MGGIVSIPGVYGGWLDKFPLGAAFAKEGTITAATSSSISDGAAAVVLMEAKDAEKRGINLDTIQQYAAADVDYVSVGGLIHQARSLDLSLKAVINK
mgnify:CR=1 FL=1